MSSTLPSHQVTQTIPAVAIVVDSSLTLAREWHHILLEYCKPLFARLAEGNAAFLPQLRLGFVTYGPPNCSGGTPLLVNRFFAVGAHNELKEMNRLSIGTTTTGGSLGMAALEGYAAAIEMFDSLKNGVNQKPLRPLSLNESRDRPKEVYSYHLWHFAAGQPDNTKNPLWNNSPALDSLTWKTVPAELKKREINCSMLLVSPSPKFSKLFSDISDARLAPWFPTRPNHTILLSGFTPSPKPRAAVPSTIPAKRPADSPAEQRSPGPKISKPPSQTASPALAAAKKPVLQSSPLIPPATASAPPSSSATSPIVPPATAPNSSPPKPPAREPLDGTVIDLTQSSSSEIVPPTMQTGRVPPQPNAVQQAPPTQPQPIPPTQPPTQTQPLLTPQSQTQSSMQPQSQPSSFLNLKPPPATADSVEMLTKLKQVEMRMTDLRNKQLEAAQAGRTDEANKLAVILSQHITAYKKGREFVVRMLEAKKAAAQGQGQGPSSQPAHDPAPTAGTTQHSTPRMSATPQPTPNANSHSTPRLTTPRMAANPNPNSMSASPSHATANSGVGVGSGSAANANAALLRAFNPAAAQIPTQTGLASLSGPEAHGLGAMPQHGFSHSNPLGQQQQQQPMPPNIAAQMKKLVEQRTLAQNTPVHIPAGNGAGTNGGTGAPVVPGMAGGFNETRDVQWVGTFVWQGTNPTRNEKKERTHIFGTTVMRQHGQKFYPLRLLGPRSR
ncbi:hypothetical protein EDB92DRAFT_228064 [Lactarius akahatsu]|uniref:Uncharacterized protein n=1 Tax=Lactarius akahatsu TaxID=416441 RepID=A0AAD4QFE7_9AGAM|nr:hypothetical protein EDB92DRAFT_228064 [Lactarius akahatsu]